MRGNAITMMGQRKPDEDARRRAMVRLNGMMFYSVGLASFLESTAPLDTNRLIRLSDGHADVRLWLERVWLPQRAEHGALFREYIETTWPEFEWSSACQEFQESYYLRAAARVEAPGLALEFIARCVNETALAVFYRTLGKCADEPSSAGAGARGSARPRRLFRLISAGSTIASAVAGAPGSRRPAAPCSLPAARRARWTWPRRFTPWPVIGTADGFSRSSPIPSFSRAWRSSSSATRRWDPWSGCCSGRG